MSLISRALPALYNGVSRQPAILRSPDQNEDELNTWASLSDGVGKRPPTQMVAQVYNNLSPNAFIHHINRDATERYIVIADGGILKVFDHATGANIPVTAPGGWGYLGDDPSALKAVTVADYTFIVNTKKVCEMAPLAADQAAQADYYRWINPTVTGANVFGMLAVSIAKGSAIQYAPNITGTYMGEVPSVEKLPETAANGTLYKVTGSIGSGFVSYYVRRNGAVWDETVAVGLQNAIKAESMPHCLIREPNGTFTFAPFSWAPRRVGDETTNPRPTLIGRTIRDVFFHQNRLGFLVDENVIFSCAGDFGNLWRSTVLDYMDSDVIDVAVSTANVALLNHALPFNDGILLMADQTQFSLTNGEDGMTPSSIAIRPVTNYEVNVRVRPVTIGTEVYFCGDQNGSSVVWEYTRLADNDATAAADITAHVPDFVPAGLQKLIAAPNMKAIFALTGTEEVYVYQFYWSGTDKVMSAWRKWTFSDPVIGGEFLDGKLYLLMRRPDGVYLERADLEAARTTRVFLDRQAVVTGTYDPIADRTTYVLPYAPTQGRFRAVRPLDHPARPQSLIDPSGYQWITAIHVSVPGNEPEAIIGESYTMSLTFSRQFAQNYRGQPINTGRLQLRTFTVYFSDTAFFRTEVAPYGKALAAQVEPVVAAKLAEFTGKVVGDEDLRLNRPVYATGSYSFQVYGEAAEAVISVTNDTHVASTFVSAEWEGFYWNRAKG